MKTRSKKSSFIKTPTFAALAGLGALAALRYALRRSNRMSFEGKIIVITGGSRGLGLAIAREFAREKAKLHLLARNTEDLEKAAASLRELGGEVEIWPCDLTEHSQIQETMKAIVENAGRLDVLINNAGIIQVGPFETMSYTDFDHSMRLHFWSVLHTTLAALPHLRESQGRIANIASIGGRLAVPHLAPYSASKFALAGLSDSLRNELAKEGVQVTTVSPGLMRTGSHIQGEFHGDADKEFRWFALGASLPLASINAERAARQIVEAVRRGQPDLTITLQAKLARAAQAIAPNTVAYASALVDRLLPHAHHESQWKKGVDCSRLYPEFLTALGDKASHRLNEVR